MNNKEIKLQFIEALMSRDCYVRAVSDIQYVTRCPYCGDTEKRENDGHFYIRVNPDDDYPIVYNCFLCQASGVLTKETLSMMEIDSINLKSGLMQVNKTSKKLDKKGLRDQSSFEFFDYQLPEIKRGEKITYIEDRLGKSLTDDDLKEMKVITSLRDFLVLNKITKLTCTNQMAFMYEENYVGFLTHGNSHILFRDITGKMAIPWIKYPITEASRKNHCFYTMETELDIFTEEEITINMAEGVFDILSVCHNLGYHGKNILNISVSGKYYDSILLFLVGIGLVGSNIIINIFSDNDEMYNKKETKPKMGKYQKQKPSDSTNLHHYQKVLKNYKYLFKEVNVYYNLAAKDFGIHKEDIILKKYKL